MRGSAAAALGFVACAGVGRDTGGTGGTREDGAGGPPDPSTWDCRAEGVPERASPVPVDCLLDPACRTPLVVGHRGAGSDLLGAWAPENTLSAMRAAIALGADLVEVDPRPTADGVLVAMHDDTVDRTTDGEGAVEDMTLAEVQALSIDAERYEGDYSCERVPTIVEVLELCRGRVAVLLDANKTDRVDLLVEAIHEADALEWAVLDTSSMDRIEEGLALEPELRVQIRPDSPEEAEEQLDRLDPVLPHAVELDEEDWAAGAEVAHARGTRAFGDVFVQDAAVVGSGELERYDVALDAGLDLLQTERPDLVAERLAELGLR